MIVNYNNFLNEAKSVNKNKLTYSLAGIAWNELWDKEVFKWLGKKPNIIINNKYIEDDDLGIFELLIYDIKGMYYKSLGTKNFHPIEEDRKKFFKWLIENNIIE